MSISWGGGPWGFGTWGGTGGELPPSPQAQSRHIGTGIFATLAMDEDGDLAFPIAVAKGPIAYVHRINSRLRLFMGEYFLDTRIGVPYYQTIFVKGTSLAVMNALLRKAIITTPGIVDCQSFTSTLDTKKRIAYGSWQATVDDGTILTARDEPFLVAGDSFGRSHGSS